ncbi:MAG: anti-sigma factor domain-containing protein [Solirubrobacterales bacterium]
MSASDHSRWSEDLAAYALAALEPEEAAALERHLEGCERCREELRWLAPAVRSLPEAVARQEPPPRLRESLMAEVRADVYEEAEGGVSVIGWIHRSFSSRGLKLAAGLVSLALALVAVAGYEIGKGGSGEGGASTLYSRQPGGIAAKMVREGDGGTLELAHVHQLPPKRVLEAWVRREGEVEPVPALFVPDREGRASTTIADMSGVEAVMVTEEPRGGSEEPTSPPIVTMSMPQ